MLHEAFIPHVWTMILLPVVLLVLLRGSFAKTVKTVLPQYNLELQHHCPYVPAERMRVSSFVAWAAKMISTNYYGFRYNADTGMCQLLPQTGDFTLTCWRFVSENG